MDMEMKASMAGLKQSKIRKESAKNPQGVRKESSRISEGRPALPENPPALERTFRNLRES